MTVQHLKLLEKCGYIRLSLPLVGKDKSSEIYYSGKYSKIGFYTRKKKCILTKKKPAFVVICRCLFCQLAFGKFIFLSLHLRHSTGEEIKDCLFLFLIV